MVEQERIACNRGGEGREKGGWERERERREKEGKGKKERNRGAKKSICGQESTKINIFFSPTSLLSLCQLISSNPKEWKTIWHSRK
jgi:hypothetical protein